MIRLYGTTLGQGSFARVTDGTRYALEQLGVLAGVVPLDAYDREERYPGWDAPVAVYVGDPRGVDIMMTVGTHRKRYVLLPPNSTWMPNELLAHVAKSATHLIAPSLWAYGVQQRYVREHGMGAVLWQHGVDRRFVSKHTLHEQLRTAFREGSNFHVLHMSSTSRDRKGTKELVMAWPTVIDAIPHARLFIVANRALYDRAERDGWKGAHGVGWIAGGQGYGVDAACRLYQMHHVVCQPSRGEGFGIVPLEARACGIPVVATAATGHADHVDVGRGVELVPHGPDGPTDDGPGAVSPTVQPGDIAAALMRAYNNWPALAEYAYDYAPELQRDWAWETVTKRWIERCDVLSDTTESKGVTTR